MYGFTAQDAREIVAKESYTTRGYVIDQIRKAALNGQDAISIPGLRLKDEDKEQFINDGFMIDGNKFSWKD